MIYHVTRATRIFIFWTLIILALGSTGLRFILAEVKNYKAELEVKIGEILDVPFKIGTLSAHMRGFNPELVLQQISIPEHETGNQAIQLREIRLGIKVLDVIKDQNLFSSTWMTLVGAKLTVKRKRDGTFAVVGLKANDEQPAWLMQGGRYEVLDSEVSWIDEMRQAKTEVLQHVNIVLNNLSDNQHQLRMHVNLPEKLGKKLTLMMDFSGDIFTTGVFNGKLYGKAQQVLLTEIFASEIPTDYKFDSGLTDFQLWSEWQNSKMVKLTGNVQIQKGSVAYKTVQKMPIDDLAVEFLWQRQEQQWQLDISKLGFNSGDKQWPEASFSLLMEPQKKFVAAISQMDINQASELALFSRLLGEKNHDLLGKLNLQGKMTNLTAFANLLNSDFTVNGEIANLGFAAIDKLPALQGLSGWVKGTANNGVIRLASDSVRLNMPHTFEKPLQIRKLQGQVNWQQNVENWQVFSDLLDLEGPEIKTRNRFQVTISKKQNPLFINWQSELTDAYDVIHSKKYFPIKKMDKEFSKWLAQLLIGGQIETGKLNFYGRPDDFPFKKGTGIFQADIGINKLGLSYSPEWPHLTELDGIVQFHNDKFSITANNGQSSGQKLSQLQVSLPSSQKDIFWSIKGKATGTIEQTLNFMSNSPLAEKTETILRTIAPEGTNNIDFNLSIPVMPEEQAKWNVVAQLDKSKMMVLPVNLPVTAIQGNLIFTEQGISCQNFKGEALGYPVSFNIAQDNEKSTLNVEGTTEIQNLRQQFPTDWWQAASGSLAYQLQFMIPHEKNEPATLQLQSNLQGLKIDLPETLAKQAEHSKPLELNFNLNDSNLMPVWVNYNDQLKMAAMIDKQKIAMYSVDLVYGKGNAKFMSMPGWNININREQLKLDSWFSGTKNEGSVSAFFEQLNTFSFQVNQLNWQSQSYGNIDLTLNKNKATLSGIINSPLMAGNIAIQQDADKNKKIILNLSRLNLTTMDAPSSNENNGKQISPSDLPLFDVNSEKVFWDDKDLGSLSLKTKNIERGLSFTELELKSNNSHLTIETGLWEVINGEQKSSFKGKWQEKKFGVFLSTMGLTESLIDSNSLFKFNLHWPAAPFKFTLAKLKGTINARLKEGRILGIEPGLGRILGVLDVWRLDRRMRLDFSDLFLQGLSFDEIYGDYELANGLAITDNLIINAPSAKIKFKGETNFLKKTLNHDVLVIPKSAEVIPIAGKIVGGVADALTKTITGKRKEGMFFGAHYKIQGSWSDPQVISQPENDGLIRKLWPGSWGN